MNKKERMYLLSAVFLLQGLLGYGSAAPPVDHLQYPLLPSSLRTTLAGLDTSTQVTTQANHRPLQGRFLHITGCPSFCKYPKGLIANESLPDFHPDPYYKTHSSTSEDDACHHGSGPAGYYGAETTDCDSPFSLINSTFAWIDAHLKGKVDFVIWTGDSARHDNDDRLPRGEQQVIDLNDFMAHKFSEVFGKSGDPEKDFTVPIVPTFGNNDVLPHNIFKPGPNRWTRRFTRIWHKFIPQEQVHTFERGGWFFVEVIPNKLAVFSLNTLYFFDSNTAVDGCADKSEPGYEQFEWLRIQLEFFRQRGMKVIMTGHVPPARTDNKMSWDETCWHKYAFWMQQYRDVVIGSMYGHMNMDHFMLQDFEDIDHGTMNGRGVETHVRTALKDDLTIQSSQEYLTDLQSDWADLPSQPDGEVENERKKSKGEKYLKNIGGEFAQRFSVSLVAPSVVPNFFPTMRVVEYNITGLNEKATTSYCGVPHSSTTPSGDSVDNDHSSARLLNRLSTFFSGLICTTIPKPGIYCPTLKPHKPSFIAPLPPPASAPPGPAYSPQPLSWISYTQYFANLTKLNGDFTPLSSSSPSVSSSSPSEVIDFHGNNDDDAETQRWHEGKHKGRKPKSDSDGRGKHHDRVKKLVYEVEYDTKTDKIFNLTNLSVRSLLELAGRIGEYEDRWNLDVESGCEQLQELNGNNNDDDDGSMVEIQGKKSHHHRKDKKESRKRRKQRRKSITELWYTFVSRAFVGSKSEGEIRDHFL